MSCANTIPGKKTSFVILSIVGVFLVLYINSILGNLPARALALRYNLNIETYNSNTSLENSTSSWFGRFLGKNDTQMGICNETANLVGPIPVITTALSWDKLNVMFPEVKPGGRWRPNDCESRHHMGIVIPYRNRDEHLRLLLRHVHPLFAKQQLDYGIYVVEQGNSSAFNRGMLMNIGFVEALKMENYSCFVFSDVDHLPENDKNIYGCPDQPRHLAVARKSHGYKLLYRSFFGGVENFRKEHFSAINGFSNIYFGWGAEDDDLYQRVTKKGYKLTRPPIEIGRYTMALHKPETPSPKRMHYLSRASSRMHKDGLNSLKYKVVALEKRPLYTLVSVMINRTEVMRGQ